MFGLLAALVVVPTVLVLSAVWCAACIQHDRYDVPRMTAFRVLLRWLVGAL